MVRLYLFSALVCLSPFYSAVSRAALHDRGSGLIYDDILEVTWLQDANYLLGSGSHGTGRVSWFDALAAADDLTYYDSVRDIVWDDWRLPSAYNIGTSVVCTSGNCVESELGHLQLVDGFGIFDNVPSVVTHWTSTEVEGSTFPGGLVYVYNHSSADHFGTSKDPVYKPTAWFLRDGDVVAKVPETSCWLLLVLGVVAMLSWCSRSHRPQVR